MKEKLAPKCIPKLSLICKTLCSDYRSLPSCLLQNWAPSPIISSNLQFLTFPGSFSQVASLQILARMHARIYQAKENIHLNLCYLYQVPHGSFLFIQLLKRIVYTHYLYSFTLGLLSGRRNLSSELIAIGRLSLFTKANLIFNPMDSILYLSGPLCCTDIRA